MSIWNRGPDRIPDMLGALNMSLYKALVGIQKRVQGPQYKEAKVVALGASPATYTNDFPYDVEVSLLAFGTVLDQVRFRIPTISSGVVEIIPYNNPLATANTGYGPLRLSPGDSVVVYYTGAAPIFSVIER